MIILLITTAVLWNLILYKHEEYGHSIISHLFRSRRQKWWHLAAEIRLLKMWHFCLDLPLSFSLFFLLMNHSLWGRDFLCIESSKEKETESFECLQPETQNIPVSLRRPEGEATASSSPALVTDNCRPDNNSHEGQMGSTGLVSSTS